MTRYLVINAVFCIFIIGNIFAGEIIMSPKKANSYDKFHKAANEKYSADMAIPGGELATIYPGHSLEWIVPSIANGSKYRLGVWMLDKDFFSFSERYAQSVNLFINDRLVPWTSYSIPQKCGEKREHYYSILTSDSVLTSGDIVRITSRHAISIGSLVLSSENFSGNFIDLPPILQERYRLPLPVECSYQWETTKRDASEITQGFSLTNTASLLKKYHVTVVVQDWFRNVLTADNFDISIEPGEEIIKEYRFAQGDSGRVSMAITVSCDGYLPLDKIKYFIDDIKTGPMRRMWLNGEWNYKLLPLSVTEPGKIPAADDEWETICLPSYLPKDKSHCAWLKKSFDAPEYIKGERYVIKFGGFLYEGWIYVNGKLAGHQYSATEPFEVDITDYFLPEKKNEVVIGLRDWIAYSPINRQRIKEGKQPDKNKDLIHPVGHYCNWYGYGINTPICLETRPDVGVADVSIATDVEPKKLHIKYVIVNKSGTDTNAIVRPVVNDAGDTVFALPQKELKIPAGGSQEVSYDYDWADPILWEPGKPHLYLLQTSVEANAKTSVQYNRFGFRDLAIDGINFKVNGKPMKIRSQWTKSIGSGYQANMVSDYANRLNLIWESQKNGMSKYTTQLYRAHNQIAIDDVCEIADETGLILKIEDGNICQMKFTKNEEYWDNCLKSELSMIDAYKNHASLFLWSAGNENIWCFGHGGQDVLNFAYPKMFNILQKMEQYDFQKRLVEWEADADLNGRTRYYALHYPREISSGESTFPNDAWFGPLDGKSEIKYSHHDVRLGKKPVTVGEANCPGYLNKPYGLSVLLGDDVFLGGWFWRKAFYETSQYYLNGMRDAEMALIDTYCPMSLVKPQTIVMKNLNTRFFGGNLITKNINIHNDTRFAEKFTIVWNICDKSGNVILSNSKEMLLTPAELKRVTLTMKLPNVTEVTAYDFRITLRVKDRDVDVIDQDWAVYPAKTISLPDTTEITVYDPNGQTVSILKSLGVNIKALSNLSEITGNNLFVAPDALADIDVNTVQPVLQKFVMDGGKVCFLAQKNMPEYLLPFSAVQVQGTDSTICFNRAPEHPVMNGISDDDLRWWGNGHIVSENNFKKPFTGNWLALVDSGTIDGCENAPLFEQYLGKGSYLSCQMLLVEKCKESPVAAKILENILFYLSTPGTFRKPSQTLAYTNKELKELLDKMQISYSPLAPDTLRSEGKPVGVVILSASMPLADSLITQLQTYAQHGGKILIQDVTPESKEQIEKLSGVSLILDSCATAGDDVKNHVIKTTQSGFMSGISNQELLWASAAYAKAMISSLRWNSSIQELPESNYIVNYFCRAADLSKAQNLTQPCALLSVPYGEGVMLISQFNYTHPLTDTRYTAQRLASVLLTNLGCTVKSSGQQGRMRNKRLGSYEFETVDLSPYANRGLKDDKENDITGWSNQGDNDMRNLPVGSNTFNGVPFYITDQPNAAITLYSKSSDNLDLPRQVNIEIHRKANSIFFLHSLAWSNYPLPFMYQVNYADGTKETLNMYNGQHVVDWWLDPIRYANSMAASNTVVAWSGPNGINQDGVRIYCYEWVNKNAEKVIDSIDFMTSPASEFKPVVTLAGITTAIKKTGVSDETAPLSGKITAIIGNNRFTITHAGKEYDIYAIGVKRLTENHPYAADASAQIKKLFLGKDVTLNYGEVNVSPEGKTVAYLHVKGEGDDISTSINGKLIGEGLGDVGEFYGNQKNQSYLLNLQTIAKLNKIGMWKYSE